MTVTRRPRPKKEPAQRIQSERLKTYLEATKAETVLLGPVSRHLQLESLKDDRPTDVIHPSEMASKSWCARATWHRLAGHPLLVLPTPPALRLSMIFEVGTNIHSKWQRWFQGMGWLWGNWLCVACNKVERNCFPDQLPLMGSIGGWTHDHVWVYAEVSLSDPVLRIAGHADGIVQPGYDDERYLIEVKSIGPGTLRKLGLLSEDESDELSPDKFSRITHILGDHFRQTQTYLELTHRDPSVVPVEKAVVLYEHKSDQQVREFVLDYNPDSVADLFSTAEDIIFALKRDIEVRCARSGCAACLAYEVAAA